MVLNCSVEMRMAKGAFSTRSLFGEFQFFLPVRVSSMDPIEVFNFLQGIIIIIIIKKDF